MALNTPEFGIPYGWALNEDPGVLPADQFRLEVDAIAPKAFGMNVFATAGLTYGYHGGIAIVAGVLSRVAGGTIAMTVSTTNYVERTAAGVVTVNTTGWTSGKYAMAKVVTSGTAITSVQDWRCFAATANP